MVTLLTLNAITFLSLLIVRFTRYYGINWIYIPDMFHYIYIYTGIISIGSLVVLCLIYLP